MQLSQKLWVSGVMKPSRPPVSAIRDIARRTAGLVGNVFERELVHQPGADERQRQILVGAVAIDVAQRHRLDEGQVHAFAMRPADHLRDLVLIDALERHRIDLDGKPGGLCAAAMPAFTLARSPQRVMALNFSDRGVSTEH